MSKTAKGSKAAKRDIYQEVTDRIVAALEAGTAPWVRPWQAGGDDWPRNGGTGRRYNGINVFLLWMTAGAEGYSSPEWFTYKQAQAAGGQVRKGEKGTMVTLWKPIKVTKKDANGKAVKGSDGKVVKEDRLFLKHFVVFNRAQIDGLPEPVAVEEQPEPERHAAAEAFVKATGAAITHGGGRACYSPLADSIRLPELRAFDDAGAYYATALHELVHWSGHKTRLDRDLTGRFGDESYAAEELIAEMGAAFLCADLRIEGRTQHPEYIASWIKVLKDDKKALFTAASKARQAAEYMNEITETKAAEAA